MFPRFWISQFIEKAFANWQFVHNSSSSLKTMRVTKSDNVMYFICNCSARNDPSHFVQTAKKRNCTVHSNITSNDCSAIGESNLNQNHYYFDQIRMLKQCRTQSINRNRCVCLSLTLFFSLFDIITTLFFACNPKQPFLFMQCFWLSCVFVKIGWKTQ